MTRHYESSRPPRRGIPAAGEATSTGQAGAPAPEGVTPPARPGQRCECGHVLVLHDIAKKTKQRTACSVSSGPKATPCGCRRFAAATEPLNQENPS